MCGPGTIGRASATSRGDRSDGTPPTMGWVGTMVLGVIGSFVGGTLAALLFGGTLELSAAGLIGAIIALLVYRWMKGRRTTV